MIGLVDMAEKNTVQNTGGIYGSILGNIRDMVNNLFPAVELADYERSFLRDYQRIAQDIHKEYGIPASVTLAQAAHESSWGRSSLAALYNNFFGVKGSGDAGSVTLTTTEYIGGVPVQTQAQFAVYSSPEASFRAYANLLKGDRYKSAFGVGYDPIAFVDQVVKSGYATDPAYTDKIRNFIEGKKLYVYDAENAGFKMDSDEFKMYTTFEPGKGAGSNYGTLITEANRPDIENREEIGVRAWVKTGARAVAVLVLGVFLLVIVIQALPIPHVDAAKNLLKGANS